jgi:hypothetical protein
LASRKRTGESSDAPAYEYDFERRATRKLKTNAEIQKSLGKSDHVDASVSGQRASSRAARRKS